MESQSKRSKIDQSSSSDHSTTTSSKSSIDDSNRNDEIFQHRPLETNNIDFDSLQSLTTHVSPALRFKVVARWNKARASVLSLPHSTFITPVFMPVGTQGTVKALTPTQLKELGCGIILGNTYHLGHRPGGDIVEKMGGLHNFMNWNRSILTDSGGFQMVSLLKLAEITEEGVTFESPHDRSRMVLTPEKSIELQNQIGADIMMALDDVVHSLTTGPRVEEAMHRTLRWIDRCISAHKKPNQQNLFGIVQGGLDENLRKQCLSGLISRDLPGYAIGGLSGGESKDSFWKMVDVCTDHLPFHKPRYLMGVGYALDLVVCTSLGVDMFDCVYPTRTARFGTALVPSGTMHLPNKEFVCDFTPIDSGCTCLVCKQYTRAAINNMMNSKQQVAQQLLSYHNIHYQMQLMNGMRDAIIDQRLETHVQEFMRAQFPQHKNKPQWAVDALLKAGIVL